MRLSLLLFVLFFQAISGTSLLRFNLPESKVQSNREWMRVLLVVNGGVQPYDYVFTMLPKGWKEINNYIYLPKTTLNFKGKYPFRIIVRDSNGGQKKACLLFIVRHERIFIVDELFDYNHKFDDEFFAIDGSIRKPEFNFYKDLGAPQETKEEKIQEQTVEEQKKEVKVEENEAAQIQKQTVKIEKQKVEQKQKIEESEKLVQTVGSGLQVIVDKLVPEKELGKNIPDEIKKVKDLIKNEAAQVSNFESIESIFADLPNQDELDQIILKHDVYLMSKTIQKVVSHDKLACENKIAYLSDFYGRIRSAVQIKSFTLSQLKVIVEAAKKQIERLDQEIQFLDQEIQTLEVKKLRDELKKEVDKLEEVYNIFNKVDSQISPKESAIQKFNEEISSLRVQADNHRQTVVNKKLALTQIKAEISRLEQELKSAKSKKTFIQNEIHNIEISISQIQTKIDDRQAHIKTIEKQIKDLGFRADQLKKLYTDLEVAVERLRSNLSKSIEKRDAYKDSIDQFNERLQKEQKKIVTEEISLLAKMIEAVRRNLPNLQEKMDKLYYECYETEEVESQLDHGIIVYLLNSHNFEKYIKKVYGLSVSTASITATITFNRVNIFSEEWNTNYGSAYSDNELAKARHFSIGSDFNCLNPSTLVNGKGKITNIDNNLLTIERDDKTEITLKLGACTRLQSTEQLPKLGQSIYWKGNKSKLNLYEAYSASCFN